MGNLDDREEELVELGLTAPRVTLDHILGVIAEEQYMFEGTYTICLVTTVNGFKVSGTSACAHPDNFNKAIGMQYAKEKVINKLWELEGYLLKQKLYEQGLVESKEEGCEIYGS